MPFKSAKQRAWAHTKAGEAALGGPAKVNEWDEASNYLPNIPDRSPGTTTGNRYIKIAGNRGHQKP